MTDECKVSPDVIVIGAGVVGLSVALALQGRGLSVRVLDRKGVAAEASRGNAGAFAFSDVLPLASPGILRKAPKWLLDPDGPLSIPVGYLPAILPWLLRFWRASWRDRVAASTLAQASLNRHSMDSLDRLIRDIRGETLLRREGQLALYGSRQSYQAALPGWAYRRDFGIAFEHLEGADAIAGVQPGLSSAFRYATYTPDWLNVTDPFVYTTHLAETFRARGGRVEIADVCEILPSETGAAIRTDSGMRSAEHVVLCAGAWSHRLARSLGDRIPLETERGYNTTLPAGAFDLRTHLTFGDHGFVVSRIGDGVRVGGAAELGGLSRPPRMQRAAAMLARAKRFLPDLVTDGGVQWMGFRPSLPDSLPVIGCAPASSRVFYAFGHGHLGLTQSAGTAELIADLVTGRAPAINLHPFRPTRF